MVQAEISRRSRAEAQPGWLGHHRLGNGCRGSRDQYDTPRIVSESESPGLNQTQERHRLLDYPQVPNNCFWHQPEAHPELRFDSPIPIQIPRAQAQSSEPKAQGPSPDSKGKPKAKAKAKLKTNPPEEKAREHSGLLSVAVRVLSTRYSSTHKSVRWSDLGCLIVC